MRDAPIRGRVRIAYFGLPLGALLLDQDGHDLVTVALSRTDAVGLRRAQRRFAGRLWEKPRIVAKEWATRLREARAELLVSWFWTNRLPMALVEACPLGGFGVHPSLLPRHRGPDPYFWAIESGDEVTGVTAHRIAADYDTGAMLAQRELRIDPRWDAWRLARALDRPSLALLREVAARFASGDPPADQPQREQDATLAPAPDDDWASLDLHQPTERLLRRVRALGPTPGAYFALGDDNVVVLAAEVAPRFPRALEPGEAAVVDGHAVLRTGDGAMRLLRGQREGDETELGASELAALVAAAVPGAPNGDSVGA